MNVIRIINEGAEPFVGRYDGRDYEFEVGKPVDVPLEAARHCFGFGEADKREALSRMGWLSPRGTMKDALAKLSAIRFLEGQVVFDSVELAISPNSPATNARPHVNRPPEGKGPPASPASGK